MRVCLIAYRFYDGNSHMLQFARALAGRGDQVDVICLRAKGRARVETVDGVRVFRIATRSRERFRFAGYLFRLALFIVQAAALAAWRCLRHGYDLVHVQTVPDVLMLAAIGPKLLRTPVLLDLRDLSPELFASKFQLRSNSALFRLLLQFEKAAAGFADHVIVANPIWLERVAGRSAARSKCTSIWYYPDPELFPLSARKPRQGRFTIHYPGSLHWHQGLDIALEAFAKFHAELPGSELWIQGEGPEKRDLKRLARELGVGDSVRWLAPVPVSEIASVMGQADLAIVPKRSKCAFGSEAASTKIAEFMAVGVPVVASRTRIDSLFYDDSVIRFYDNDDPRALAEAMLAVARDPELALALRTNAARFLRESAWEGTVAAYRRLATALASPAPPAAPSAEALEHDPRTR